MSAIFDPTAIGSEPATTIIEASAGTGKTTAIAGLTVRALAEGWCTIDQTMLVTFGRRASSELRSKFHARLTHTIDCLEHAARGEALKPQVDDGIHQHLVGGTPAQRTVWLGRLRLALADFDRATIATTHQFCHAMLNELGVLADFDPAATFLEDGSDLVNDAFDDSYLQTFLQRRTTMYSDVRRALRSKVAGTALPLVTSRTNDDAEARLQFARTLRRELEVRKWRMGLYGFDDMVVRLHRALAADDPTIDRTTLPAPVAAARQALSDRFALVMIDEYQDTDTLQWQIARAAFHGHSRLLLIGDPKQAIYGFRGADVRAYLAARAQAGDQHALLGNHRSSPEVVAGVDALLAGRQLGEEAISVAPADSRCASCTLTDASGARLPAVQLRLMVPASSRDGFSDTEAERAITHDVVAEVGRLLGATRTLDDKSPRIARHDIHVLVRTNERGRQLHRALLEAGIPTVFAGSDSVFASSAAADFEAVLQALVDPTAEAVRRVALTDIVGKTLPELSGAIDREISDLALALRRAGRTLDRHGLAAMFDELGTEYDIVPRLLSRPDGERLLTDLRHVAELLQDHISRHPAPSETPGATAEALVTWLRDQRGNNDGDERTRRLETDTSAVQIMTIHRAKGLTLPVVLLPDCATSRKQWESRFPLPGVVHVDGEAFVSVMPTEQERDAEATAEADEQLRLLYVAVTRAQHALRLWWAPSETAEASPLNRLLQAGDTVDRAPAQSAPASSATARQLQQQWAEALAAVLVEPRAVEPAPLEDAPRPMSLSARRLTRPIDRDWGRTSYSALTAPIGHEPGHLQVAEEDDEPVLDETVLTGTQPATPSPGTDVESPLCPLPGGADFGTLVHGVLEVLDWQADDLTGELRRVVADQTLRHPVTGVPAETLAEGLDWVVNTPLGRLTDGRSLRELPLRDRLAELDFEMPLGPTSQASGCVGDLAALFSDRTLVAEDDPFADYGADLGDSEAAATRLTGWITGSIDAVLRVPGPHGPRHVVVDYKTNRIPVPAETPLRVSHYTHESMSQAMRAAHYPLQALIYCVALHRFLRSRLANYSPAQHLGGVGYLFVRGMAGAEGDRERPLGVFDWYPSVALVEAADAVMGGKR